MTNFRFPPTPMTYCRDDPTWPRIHNPCSARYTSSPRLGFESVEQAQDEWGTQRTMNYMGTSTLAEGSGVASKWPGRHSAHGRRGRSTTRSGEEDGTHPQCRKDRPLEVSISGSPRERPRESGTRTGGAFRLSLASSDTYFDIRDHQGLRAGGISPKGGVSVHTNGSRASVGIPNRER
jgi:hypothetical protein